jgi:hypothetical protein
VAQLHDRYDDDDDDDDDEVKKKEMAYIVERRSAYGVLVGKPDGKRPLGRPGCRWEDNIKMDDQEVGAEHMDWIGMGGDRHTW